MIKERINIPIGKLPFSVHICLQLQQAKMSAMHRVILLSLIACIQASSIPEKPHFLTPVIDIVNSAGSSWKAGHNFHHSVTKRALKHLCGVKPEAEPYNGPYKSAKMYGTGITNYHSNSIPDFFDAREHWPQCPSIGHIRDQGHCGSCWAFAVTSTLTDRFCIATNGKFRPELSAEDLLTCCNECGHGCDGATPSHVWKHLTKHGIVTGGDHNSNQGCKPYSIEPCEHHVNGSLPQCKDFKEILTPTCHYKCSNGKFGNGYWKDQTHKVQGYYKVNETTAIQKEIMANGPVQASFTVFEDFLTYKSGVYQHLTGKEVDDHAVKIIGWGETNGTPYWMVINSWNKHWGDEGLFKIRRGTNECKIEEKAFAPTPDLSEREKY